MGRVGVRRFPAFIPSRGHIAGVPGSMVLVAAINRPVSPHLGSPNGIGHGIEFSVVILERRPIAPLFFRHEESHGHIFIRVSGGVGAQDGSSLADVPVHDVISAGVRHPLVGVFIEAVKKGPIPHGRRDQHAVANAFGHRVITRRVHVAKNPIAIGAGRVAASCDARIDDVLVAPLRV